MQRVSRRHQALEKLIMWQPQHLLAPCCISVKKKAT